MDPVLVEVTRGNRVESRHAGAACVVDADGRVAFAAGDIDAAHYPRSAVKALLALPLVESGGADRMGLTDAEIALTCASHSGEEVHVAAAASMLAKAGRDETCLECGSHWPINEAASRRLAGQGATPSALHNNCSGKHSGFICLACHRGEDPKGYVRADHPTMRVITAALADMTGTKLDDSNRAVDGCSIPTHAVPLRALAHAFARFGAGAAPPDRARAIARIRAAVAANPMMVGGSGRFDTRLMTALGARVFSKGGAEGMFCAALPEQGLGIAVKCHDGAGRAAEVATAALISRYLPDPGSGAATLAELTRRELRNWNGIAIGRIEPSEALLPARLRHIRCQSSGSRWMPA